MGCGLSSSENNGIIPFIYKKVVPFQKNSKIAIIGGGAGGVHIAYLLKQKGYSNVTIFEKEQEVGGKAHSITIENIRYDTGPVATLKDRDLIDLFKSVGLFENLQPLDQSMTSVYSKEQNKLVSRFQYVQSMKGFTNKLSFKLAFDKQLNKYKEIYYQIVDEFGFPNALYVTDLIKPVKQFFHENELDILYIAVSIRLISQGYDRGDMILFYVLFFIQPEFLNPESQILQMNKNFGWQDVWTSIVKKENIKVEQNKSVQSVEYLESEGKVNLIIKDMLSNEQFDSKYDFCIFAIPNSLQLIKNPSFLQKSILDKFCHFYPVYTMIYKIKKNHQFVGVYDLNTYEERNSMAGISLYRKNYNADNDFVIDVAYQYFKPNYMIDPQSISEIENSMLQRIQYLLKEQPVEKVYTQIYNNYLPHCLPKDISEGAPWELFKLQGENKMWFTSAFTCFDLTQSIIKYNIKLLNQYNFE